MGEKRKSAFKEMVLSELAICLPPGMRNLQVGDRVAHCGQPHQVIGWSTFRFLAPVAHIPARNAFWQVGEK